MSGRPRGTSPPASSSHAGPGARPPSISTANADGDHTVRDAQLWPHLYRPAASGALVFACSHLHEVTEVRQGRRFVLLSFLFGEGESRPVRARSTESPPPPSS